MKATFIGLLLISSVLAGCSRTTTAPIASGPAPENPPPPTYAAGEVLVGFQDGVNEQQADAMFVAHGLTWESHFLTSFTYWVQVESGDLDVLVARLSGSPIVAWAEYRGNPNGVPNAVYLIVHFKDSATDATAQALIDSIDGLSVSSKLYPPRWATARVEAGREEEWVATLEQEPIVKYASLNRYAYPSY